MTRTNIEDTEGVVIHEHFACSKEELWATITDPDELRAWLGADCAIEPRVGGRVQLTFPDDGLAGSGVVRQWKPPAPAYSLAGFTHTFVDAADPDRLHDCAWWIIPTSDGCDLRFTLQAVDGPNTTPVEVAEELLRSAKEILLVDWVTKDIPRTLLEAGFSVVAKNGPEPDDYGQASLVDGDVAFTPTAIPTHADLLHLDWTIDFDEYLELATQIGVHTFWYHSATTQPPAPADVSGCWVPSRKSARLRAAVEAAGMHYVDDRYIVDVARRIRAT